VRRRPWLVTVGDVWFSVWPALPVCLVATGVLLGERVSGPLGPGFVLTDPPIWTHAALALFAATMMVCMWQADHLTRGVRKCIWWLVMPVLMPVGPTLFWFLVWRKHAVRGAVRKGEGRGLGQVLDACLQSTAHRAVILAPLLVYNVCLLTVVVCWSLLAVLGAGGGTSGAQSGGDLVLFSLEGLPFVVGPLGAVALGVVALLISRALRRRLGEAEALRVQLLVLLALSAPVYGLFAALAGGGESPAPGSGG